MLKKIAIITISLVKESAKKPNNKIEKEILRFLEKSPVPWMEKVEKVKVLGSSEDVDH